MRDPERIARILAKLAQYWAANPDARLCQIVGNALPGPPTDKYHVEDDELERGLDDLLR